MRYAGYRKYCFMNILGEKITMESVIYHINFLPQKLCRFLPPEFLCKGRLNEK
jgi:hypothetical protein